MENNKSSKAKKSQGLKRDDASNSKKNSDKKGDPIEEYIDSEPSQEVAGENKPNRPDAMGISKKAKKQASDESDVRKNK